MYHFAKYTPVRCIPNRCYIRIFENSPYSAILGSESMKSEESGSGPIVSSQATDASDVQSVNESENSQQSCLKLTIRVRRLNHFSNTNSSNK